MIGLCKAAGLPAPQFRQDGGQFVQTLRRPTGGDGAQFVRPESGLESRLHRQVVLTIPKRLRPYCLYRRALLVPRGSVGRTPALWDLALRLAYELPLRRGLRGRLVPDVLHVGNPRRATTVDETLYTTPDQTSPNPQYKQPLAYQAPMAARVGLEITF